MNIPERAINGSIVLICSVEPGNHRRIESVVGVKGTGEIPAVDGQLAHPQKPELTAGHFPTRRVADGSVQGTGFSESLDNVAESLFERGHRVHPEHVASTGSLYSLVSFAVEDHAVTDVPSGDMSYEGTDIPAVAGGGPVPVAGANDAQTNGELFPRLGQGVRPVHLQANRHYHENLCGPVARPQVPRQPGRRVEGDGGNNLTRWRWGDLGTRGATTGSKGTVQVVDSSMTELTKAQTNYLAGQRLGRIATSGADGKPHVVPTSFRHNSELGTIDVGGFQVANTKKYRDVLANPWAAIVVDDLVSIDPWRPRMLEIRGRAEAVASGGAGLGPGFGDSFIRIHPHKVNSFGID